MRFSDEGFILDVRRQGEHAALISLFTRDHGRHSGLVKGAFSKKKRAQLVVGNQLQVEWHARLSEHLGAWECEIMHPTGALLMQDRLTLHVVSYLSYMLYHALPEREPHPVLYEALSQFYALLLQPPAAAPSHMPQMLLVWFEMLLLQELGYALDLSCCAATGVLEPLAYISPKSGRAVSQAAGAPYAAKLFPFPTLLKQMPDNALWKHAVVNNAYTESDIVHDIEQAARVTHHFITTWLLEPHYGAIPPARQVILSAMSHHNRCDTLAI